MQIFSLFGEVLLRDAGVSSQLNAIDRQASSVGTSMSNSFNGIANTAVKLGGILLGGLGIKSLIEKSYELADSASDLVEAQNVVETTFKTSGKAIEAWTQTTAKSAGISQTSSMQWVGFMGAMLKSSGVSEEASASMSKNLVQLTGDMSSFYNVSTSDMWEKLRSGISGETEPLKQIGINMSVANLQAYALAEGIKKPYAEMTQGEQTTLRYNYLMSVTKDAQGDFGKTLEGSFANQVRVAKLNLEDLGRSIGSKLLPYFMDGVSWINQHMPEIQSTMTNVANGVNGAIDLVLPKFQQWGTLIGEIADELFPSFGDSTKDVDTKATELANGGLNLVTSALTWIKDNIEIVKGGIIGLTAAWAIQQGVIIAHNVALVAHNIAQAVRIAQDKIETAQIIALYVAEGIHNGVIAVATAAQWAFNAALSANPIGIVITLVVALATGLVLLFEKNKTFHDFVINSWTIIKQVVSDSITAVIGFFQNLDTNISQTWDNIKRTTSTKLNDWLKSIEKWFDDFPQKIKQKLTDWENSIKTWFDNFKTSINDKLDKWWNTIGIWFDSIPQKIKQKLVNWGNAIKEWTQEQNTENIRQFGEWWNNINKWFEDTKTNIPIKLNEWGTEIKKWFDDIKTNIPLKLSEWWNNISKWYDDTKTNIVNKLGDWWKSISKWFDDTKTSIPIKLGDWWQSMGKWFDDTKTDIVKKLSDWWTDIKKWFEDLPKKPEIKNAGTDSIKALTDGVNGQKKNFMDNLGKLVVDAFIGLLEFSAVVIVATARELIKRFIEAIKATSESVKTSFQETIEPALNWIKELPAQALTWGKDFIQGFVDGIMAKANSLLRTVINIANQIRSYLHFSTPDEGPLADYESWMPDFMEGLAKGIDANKYKVVDAIKGLTSNMKLSTNFSSSSSNTSSDNKATQRPTSVTHHYDIHIDKVETPNVNDFTSQLRALARLT